jgi:phosphoglycolate phosphatase-like HAD superfamily hydrolase
MIRLIVADMDGTVVDSMAVLSTLGTTLLAVAGHTTVEAARSHYDATVGMPFVEQCNAWGERHLCSGTSVPYLAQRYEDVHLACAPHFPLTDFGNGLAFYRNDIHPGCLLALVSSTRKEIIRSMPMLNHIPWSYIGGYNGPGTEKSLQIREAMKVLHIYQPEMCYVGDSESDREIATFYGIPFFSPSTTTLAEINAFSQNGA